MAPPPAPRTSSIDWILRETAGSSGGAANFCTSSADMLSAPRPEYDDGGFGFTGTGFACGLSNGVGSAGFFGVSAPAVAPKMTNATAGTKQTLMAPTVTTPRPRLGSSSRR